MKAFGHLQTQASVMNELTVSTFGRSAAAAAAAEVEMSEHMSSGD